MDFKRVANSFKEDSVRETIILPLLLRLGYKQENIIHSKTLKHPFLKIGSNKKISVRLVPDYLLKVEKNYACALDAKVPTQSVNSDDNIGQVYLYAAHPEVRSTYFALYNGAQFSLFRTSGANITILFFNVEDIEGYWGKLAMYLSSSSFHIGKNFTTI
ncbi:MAG: type I restriction enzyme HsdR N-terminal domain-containing protein [Campylobacteraceae bacterium]|nr:type I restriction enzyme HsdR N-terminal domain-containing protein [Campylobacteraceae bacterium]